MPPPRFPVTIRVIAQKYFSSDAVRSTATRRGPVAISPGCGHQRRRILLADWGYWRNVLQPLLMALQCLRPQLWPPSETDIEREMRKLQ